MSHAPLKDYTFTCLAGVATAWSDDIPNAHFWDVIQAVGFIQIEIQSYGLLTRRQGQTGEVQRGIKRVRVTSPIDQTVIISFGDDRDTNNTPDGAAGAFANDIVAYNAPINIAGGQSLSVPADGYGTAIISLTVPAVGSSILSDIHGTTIPYRYLDGRVESKGNLVPGFAGLIIVDLAGFGGFKLSYFGPSTLTVNYDISQQTHPYWLQQQVQQGIGNIITGGVHYNPGDVLETLVCRNVNTKSLSIFGQFNGGNPGDSILVSVIPVDLQGNVYPGNPWYFPVPLEAPAGGSFKFFARFSFDDAQSYYDVFSKGGGAFVGTPLPVGAADYLVRISNNSAGATPQWGVQDLVLISDQRQ